MAKLKVLPTYRCKVTCHSAPALLVELVIVRSAALVLLNGCCCIINMCLGPFKCLRRRAQDVHDLKCSWIAANHVERVAERVATIKYGQDCMLECPSRTRADLLNLNRILISSVQPCRANQLDGKTVAKSPDHQYSRPCASPATKMFPQADMPTSRNGELDSFRTCNGDGVVTGAFEGRRR